MQMSKLELAFRFTPADGTSPKDIRVTIETQANESKPFKVTIEWGDGHPADRLDWPGPVLFGLELAARFAAQRILDHSELWGAGTLEPEVNPPRPYAPEDASTAS